MPEIYDLCSSLLHCDLRAQICIRFWLILTLKPEQVEVMLEMICFLLCSELNKSSNMIASLWVKVENFWRKLDSKGQLITWWLMMQLNCYLPFCFGFLVICACSGLNEFNSTFLAQQGWKEEIISKKSDGKHERMKAGGEEGLSYEKSSNTATSHEKLEEKRKMISCGFQRD